MRTNALSAWLVALVVLLCFGASGLSCNETPVAITVTSPQHGDFIAGSSVEVTGTINKPPNTYAVDVNGVPATVFGDGTWSATVPLDQSAIFNNLVATASSELVRRRARVTVIAGDSVANGDFSLEGVALRINDSGLDSLEPVVGGLIDLDLATLLPVGTVIIDDCFVRDPLFGACLGSAKVRVANPPPMIDSFATAFDSQLDQVMADIDLLGLELYVDIDGSGLVPNCGLRISATGTSIVGAYDLMPTAGDPSKVDVTQLGNVAVAFMGFDDEFTSGACDLPIIGDIIQLFLPDIQDTTEGGVRDFLNAVDAQGNTPVAGAVEDALAGIDISGPIGAALGAQLDAPFFQIFEDDSGITLGSDVRFVATCTPPAGAPTLSASYSRVDPFPTLGPTTPGGGLPYGIGICISTSGMNQLLRAQTECGLLLTSITELSFGGGPPAALTAGTLAAFVPAFSAIDPTTPVRIDLRPTLAPIFSGNPGPNGELAELKLGALRAQVVPDDGSGDVYLEFSIDATVGVNLALDEASGEFVFQLAQPPASALHVAILNNAIGADETQLETILPSILAFVFPSLASSLASFPVPTFLDLQLSVISTERSGEFISIFADLLPPPG